MLLLWTASFLWLIRPHAAQTQFSTQGDYKHNNTREVLCYKVAQRKDCTYGLANICEVLCNNGQIEDYKGLYGTATDLIYKKRNDVIHHLISS